MKATSSLNLSIFFSLKWDDETGTSAFSVQTFALDCIAWPRRNADHRGSPTCLPTNWFMFVIRARRLSFNKDPADQTRAAGSRRGEQTQGGARGRRGWSPPTRDHDSSGQWCMVTLAAGHVAVIADFRKRLANGMGMLNHLCILQHWKISLPCFLVCYTTAPLHSPFWLVRRWEWIFFNKTSAA